jgi:hypothetical protein
MLRCIILLAALAAVAPASIWPEHLGKYGRKSANAVDTSADVRAQSEEYGLQEVESADFGSFKATASRFNDSTGAFAASLEPSGRLQTRVGNYLILCSGNCPKDLAKLAAAFPHISHATLPILPDYLPTKDRVPGAERYILGPVGLRSLAPSIPESLAGFQYSPEAAFARYRTRKGDQFLVIFSYPTPQIAREEATGLEKAAIGSVKRTGPFVAVIPNPPDPDAAQKLLANINYKALVSWNEPIPIPIRPQSIGQMILAIIELAGIVVGFCVLSGLAFGGYRILSRRFGHSGAGDSIILLDLRDK